MTMKDAFQKRSFQQFTELQTLNSACHNLDPLNESLLISLWWRNCDYPT